MSDKPITRPHPPSTPAQKVGRVVTPHRPTRPLCNQGAGACVCPLSAGGCESGEKPGEWIPRELLLPDTLEDIERGRIVQAELFPERAMIVKPTG